MEGLFYLIASLLFKACPNMPFLFFKSDLTPYPSLKGEGSNKARIGSAKASDVHRIESKGETMDIQTDLKQLSEDYLRIEQAIL